MEELFGGVLLIFVIGFILVIGVGGCITDQDKERNRHIEAMGKMGYALTNPEHDPAYWQFQKIDSCGGK